MTISSKQSISTKFAKKKFDNFHDDHSRYCCGKYHVIGSSNISELNFYVTKMLNNKTPNQ